ncbi:DUF3108 domain-containing protein [Halovulum sp. GXIMD14793]
MRKLFGKWLAVAAVLATSLAVPATAKDEIHSYTVYVGGVKVGNLNMSARTSGNRYAAVAQVTDAGVVSAFFDIDFSGRADGAVVGPHNFRPGRYTSKEVEDDGTKTREVRFKGNRPVSASFSPQRKKRDFDVVISQQTNTVDPVTAAFTVLEQRPKDKACNRTVEIFDGAKRSRLKLNALKDAGGGKFYCTGTFSRVAGYPRSQLQKKRNFPFVLQFQETSGGELRVYRFETDSTFGTVAAVRR